MIVVKRLAWDTDFFGFSVGRVDLADAADKETLRSDVIAADGFRLCYLLAHSPVQDAAAVVSGAMLVDRRTLLTRAVTSSDRSSAILSETEVAVASDLPRLRDLALQSAEYSRFRTDPAMPADAWKRLYQLWADNSLTGAMADAVLVTRFVSNVSGMVTVSAHDGVGTIGLFAVDRAARGRGLGTLLLRQAAAWFANAGCREAQVVTQGNNAGAMRVYERGGYRIANVTNVYHLWLAALDVND